MLEPKVFYRKLDFLLSRIGEGKTGKEFLFDIVKELENTFGNDLHICNGRLYEESEDEYILISKVPKNLRYKKKLSKSSPAVKVLIKNKSYIYDDPQFSIDETLNNIKDYTIPAAITFRGPEYRYILIYELKSGWEREAISFCLNAFNSALNYKLFSEAVKSEFQQAANIQKSLLPQASPEFAGFEIFGKSKPAELVGGDIYDYFFFENELGVCIGDASGHGLPAALLVRDLVTGLRMGLENHTEITHTLRKLNSVIFRSVYSTRFISLIYIKIEKNGNLSFVNAGHPPGILLSGDTIKELQPNALIFGALPEIELRKDYVYMHPGDILLLYTDGIIERINSDGEEYGKERLKEAIKLNRDKSAKELSKALFASTDTFGEGSTWKDDASLVIIKRS